MLLPREPADVPSAARVWTDEGFYGDGEAGIAFDYAAPAGIGMLQDISRLVIGKDPMRTDELWERMFKVSFWGQGGGRLSLQLSAPLTLP